MNSGLGELFEALSVPGTAEDARGRLAAVPIPGFENHRVGKNEEGRACLLIWGSSRGRWSRPPILLENMSVHFSVRCVLSRPGQSAPEEATFTVVRYDSDEKELQGYFLRVVGTILPLLGQEPGQAVIVRAVSHIVELFRALARPARKSVQGLWAELLLIYQASSPQALVSAWHATPDDRWDFSGGTERIEVKSAAGRIRQHYFSLGQLMVPDGARLVVASVFVERAGGGLSLGDLIQRVRDRVAEDHGLVAHIDRTVAESLGDSWSRALSDKFDLEVARESLAFFDSATVPKIEGDLPDGVSEVKFRSDLSGQTPTDAATLRAGGALFGAL